MASQIEVYLRFAPPSVLPHATIFMYSCSLLWLSTVLPEGEETSVLGDYFDSRGMEIFKNTTSRMGISSALLCLVAVAVASSGKVLNDILQR